MDNAERTAKTRSTFQRRLANCLVVLALLASSVTMVAPQPAAFNTGRALEVFEFSFIAGDCNFILPETTEHRTNGELLLSGAPSWPKSVLAAKQTRRLRWSRCSMSSCRSSSPQMLHEA